MAAVDRLVSMVDLVVALAAGSHVTRVELRRRVKATMAVDHRLIALKVPAVVVLARPVVRQMRQRLAWQGRVRLQPSLVRR